MVAIFVIRFLVSALIFTGYLSKLLCDQMVKVGVVQSSWLILNLFSIENATLSVQKSSAVLQSVIQIHSGKLYK